MEPTIKNKRQQYPGGDYVDTTDLNAWATQSADNDNDIFAPIDFDDVDADEFNGHFTNEATDINPNMTGDDENRRIEALKRAIDIAKLMSNVTIEGIIAIAEEVDKYLRN